MIPVIQSVVLSLPFTEKISSIELDTRHRCINLHCYARYLTPRRSGMTQFAAIPDDLIVMVVSSCLSKLFKGRIQMCTNRGEISEIHRGSVHTAKGAERDIICSIRCVPLCVHHGLLIGYHAAVMPGKVKIAVIG